MDLLPCRPSAFLGLPLHVGILKNRNAKVFLSQLLQPDIFARKFTADVLLWRYLHSILNSILEL